uniref:Uncharacterized protein n=1 Tax=Molossus molossus TaxID=27622 RepID=A0A7J8HCS8_MOLMO|nr:hypothetical protein HJG59_011086 [Molossus molossus]
MNFLSAVKKFPHACSLLETYGRELKSALWATKYNFHSPFASPRCALCLPDPSDRPDPCKSSEMSPPGELILLSCLTGFLKPKTLLQGAPCCRASHVTHGCRRHVSKACPRWATGQQPESQLWGNVFFSLWNREIREIYDLKQSLHCEQMTINYDQKCWVCWMSLRLGPGRPRSSKNMTEGQNLLPRDKMLACKCPRPSAVAENMSTPPHCRCLRRAGFCLSSGDSSKCQTSACRTGLHNSWPEVSVWHPEGQRSLKISLGPLSLWLRQPLLPVHVTVTHASSPALLGKGWTWIDLVMKASPLRS